ncbi:hypothetical protein BC826DRAFT_1144219 [Russula brevipes]|nr:hypothetical protein BC826DRAFT_1144219 [Russula brevipes]
MPGIQWCAALRPRSRPRCLQGTPPALGSSGTSGSLRAGCAPSAIARAPLLCLILEVHQVAPNWAYHADLLGVVRDHRSVGQQPARCMLLLGPRVAVRALVSVKIDLPHLKSAAFGLQISAVWCPSHWALRTHAGGFGRPPMHGSGVHLALGCVSAYGPLVGRSAGFLVSDDFGAPLSLWEPERVRVGWARGVLQAISSPQELEGGGAAERELEVRTAAEQAEQEEKEKKARERKAKQDQEQCVKATTAAAAEAEHKRKEKERCDREEHESEECASRKKEREDEGAGEETWREKWVGEGCCKRRLTRSPLSPPSPTPTTPQLPMSPTPLPPTPARRKTPTSLSPAAPSIAGF